MSLRTTVYYGRFGHVYFEACAYFWQSRRSRRVWRLPCLWPWRWLMKRGRAA